jgi:predicted phage terminase large subunit-like protein
VVAAARIVDPILQYTADEWQAMAARRSLKSFTARMFPGYRTAPHILYLVDALEQAVHISGSRLIVTMPPRHSKSLHVSENLPAWYLGRFPDNRVIAASHTAELAHTFSRRVRNKIASERYPFAGIEIAGDKANVRAWDLAGHLGGYYAVGVGGSPVGAGADLIVIDDPIRSAADADSETVREALWEWYQGTIRTRLEPGGSMIITATRWHDDDLTGRLLTAADAGGEQWMHIHMPALADDGVALWPDRWSAEALETIRSAVGSRVWQSQYQGSPQPAEGGTFKRHWWQSYRDLPDDIVRVEVLVDSAFKTGVSNDYSVCATWCRDSRGNAYLADVRRKRVEFPELIGMGMQAWRVAADTFPKVSVPLVPEDKASGQSAIQVWEQVKDVPVIPYHVGPGETKISRAEAVTPFVEGGRVFIPESAPWLDDWLDEHDRFPNGVHDDQVDTTAMALTRLLLNGGEGYGELPAATVDWLREVMGQ